MWSGFTKLYQCGRTKQKERERVIKISQPQARVRFICNVTPGSRWSSLNHGFRVTGLFSPLQAALP